MNKTQDRRARLFENKIFIITDKVLPHENKRKQDEYKA
jgi:hypothetical protein